MKPGLAQPSLGPLPIQKVPGAHLQPAPSLEKAPAAACPPGLNSHSQPQPGSAGPATLLLLGSQ